MADPSACRDLYFHPARKDFNFGNEKKSHGARSGEYGCEAKQLFFNFSKTPRLLRPNFIYILPYFFSETFEYFEI
jgi:hypothetical protein